MNDTCTRHDCPGAPRCSSGATVWHNKTVACWTNNELREWVLANEKAKHPARMEVIRQLREMCYVALQPSVVDNPDARHAAQLILGTPVDQLAKMVVMSDTVMGNWRTIAATVTQR